LADLQEPRLAISFILAAATHPQCPLCQAGQPCLAQLCSAQGRTPVSQAVFHHPPSCEQDSLVKEETPRDTGVLKQGSMVHTHTHTHTCKIPIPTLPGCRCFAVSLVFWLLNHYLKLEAHRFQLHGLQQCHCSPCPQTVPGGDLPTSSLCYTCFSPCPDPHPAPNFKKPCLVVQ
jgi:hypothetical protein